MVRVTTIYLFLSVIYPKFTRFLGEEQIKLTNNRPIVPKFSNHILRLLILVVGVLLFAASHSYAAHLKGAEIEYRCLSGNQYEITLYYYWDCTPPGLGPPSETRANNNFSYTNNCGATNPTKDFKLINQGGTEITQICASAVSSCQNSTTFDVDGGEIYIYRDTVTLSSNCIWDLRFTECCRDGKTNVSGQPNFSVDAQARTTVAACNSSPKLTAQPAPYLCRNELFIMSLGAFDADGDSMTFELVKAETGASSQVTYDGIYNETFPIDTIYAFAPNLNINPNNGDLTIKPKTIGDFTIVVKINEYDRNTQLLKGYVKRDFALFVVDCDTNNAPTVSDLGVRNVNGLGTRTDSLTVTALPSNGTLCFDIGFEDEDPDSISITSNINAILGSSANLTVNNSDPDSVIATICWPLNGVSVGTYTINVVGLDNNCPVNASISQNIDIVIGDPVAISSNAGLAFTATAETCNGSGDGSLQANFSGGVGPFKFEWYNGLTLLPDTEQVLQDPTVGGFYSFKVIDKFDNTTSGSSPIHNYQATPPIFVSNESATPASCNSVCDGSITIGSVTGGTTSSTGVTAYSYSWDNTTDTTNNPTGLCAGQYTVTITDDNNCPIIRSYNINSPPAFIAYVSDSVDVLCRGESTGSLTVRGDVQNCGAVNSFCATPDLDTVGTGSNVNGFFDYPSPYALQKLSTRQQYLYKASELKAGGLTEGKISALSFFVQTAFNASSLSNFTIKMGCNTEDTLDSWESNLNIVLDPATYNLSQIFVAQWVTHNFDRSFVWDGASNIVVEVSYSVPSSLVNGQVVNTTTSFNSSVIYYNSDTSDASVGNFITARSTNRPNVRFSNCDNNYTYSWSHSGVLNDSIAPNLAAGSYSVTVTNENGCLDTASGAIQQPDSTFRFIFSDSTRLICNDDTNGTATVTPRNGVGPYNYQWPSGVITSPTVDSMVTNLRGDSIYNVTVTDANSCQATNSFSLRNPPEIDPTHTVLQNIVCFGDDNGRVQINPTNGTAPYRYQWSHNVTFLGTDSSTAIDLEGGIRYTITVTDVNNCTDTVGFELAAPSGVLPTATFTQNLDCFGDTDGVVVVTPTNGTAPFNWIWPSGVSANLIGDSSRATNLEANISYKVKVTDNNGCIDSVNVSVSQPTQLEISVVDSADALCFGASNGTARGVPTGGTKPYTYQWSHDVGQTDSTTATLPQGRHTITVTDNNGCQAEDSVNIDQPLATMIATIDIKTDVSCNGLSDGFLSVRVQGGTRNYSYSWSTLPVQTDSFATNLTAGQYIVEVTDAQTCTASDTIVVTEPDTLEVNLAELSTLDCFGDNDAFIRVTPEGGTKPYTYEWNTAPVQTDSIADGLVGSVAGITYKVVLRDSGGVCSDSLTQVITQPTAISITKADSSNVTCFGGNNGSARITVTGGTPGYTYLWNSTPAIADSNATGLDVGNYKVVVTDQNSCTDSTNFNIEQPDAVISGFWFDLDSVSCNGANNGSATYSARGGTPPYQYTWSAGTGGLTDSVTTGLGPGEIRITVTDANGCPNLLDTAQITEPDPLVASFVKEISAGCSGGSNGSITARVTGGLAPYIYRWNGGVAGASDSTANGLSAGQVSVTIKSSVDTTCTITITDTIDQNLPIVLVVDSTKDVSCNGLSDGFIAVHGTGGDGNYIYAWSHSVALTDSSASNLSAQSYSVTVTDVSGCTPDDTTISIDQPDALLLTKVDSSNVSCFGNNDGKARINATQGTPNYTYAWSTIPVQTTDSATGLVAGIYKVIVTDDNSCTDSLQFNIEQPAQGISINDSILNHVTCFGFADGSVKFGPSGGTSPYTYNWSHDGTLNDSVATGLGPATYTVTISDANNCSITDSLTVNEPTDLSLSLVKQVNVNCFGDSSGSITARVTGGETPYTYNWEYGTITNDTVATDLFAGFVNVTVTSNSSPACFKIDSVEIVQNTSVVVTVDSSSDVNCFGQSDGFAVGTATGGIGPYIYVWSGGVQVDSTTSGLDSGFVYFSAFDNFGCTSNTDSVLIGEPRALIATIADSSDEVCSGSSDGEARVVWSGGNGNISYNWSNADNDSIADGLTSGNYKVVLTDDKGCQDSATVSIAAGITVSIALTKLSDIDCNGNNNGSVKGIVTGGTTPYVYTWSGGTVTNDTLVTDLPGGKIVLQAVDSNGCRNADSLDINEPAALATIFTIDTIPPCNGSNGQITGHVSGGIPSASGYQYQWLDNTLTPLIPAQTDSTVSNLAPGTYNLRVTDSLGCQSDFAQTLGTTNGPVITVDSVTDATCFGGDDGAIFISVTGNGPFTYLWLPDSTVQQDNDSLVAGAYSVQVTDSLGCINFAQDTVDQPLPITILMAAQQVLCFGDSNGVASATPINGVGPYSYNWSAGIQVVIPTPPFVIDSMRMELPPGFVQVTVTDSRNCTAIDSVLISEPPMLTDTVIFLTSNDCFGDTLASFKVRPIGGTGPYTYDWGAGATNDSIQSNLGAGSYIVTITDTATCTYTDTIVITQPDSLSISISGVVDISCFGAGDGQVSVDVNGGTMPYQYTWGQGNGGINDSLSQLIDTTFVQVHVGDANGCGPISLSQSLSEPSPISLSLEVQHVRCFGESNGIITAHATGGNGVYVYTWQGNVANSSDSIADSLAVGQVVVSVSDTNGCPAAVDSITVNQPDPFVSNMVLIDHLQCFKDSNAVAKVQYSGGNGGVIYLWAHDTLHNDSTVADLYADTFYVTLTDSLGCMVMDTIVISEPDSFEVSYLDFQDPLCNGSSDGSATLLVEGGAKPYQYNWNKGTAGVNDSINTGFNSGLLSVLVTDSLGCVVLLEDFVSQPLAITPNFFIDSLPSCSNNNGGITALFSGGTPFSGTQYTYLWMDENKNPIVPLQTDSFIQNLGPGLYFLAVEDSNGCVDTAFQTLNALDGPVVFADSVIHPSCVGFSNGAIFISDSGGTQPLSYLWAPTGDTTQDLTNVGQGTHTLTVTDSTGCQGFESRSLFDPVPIVIQFTDTVNESCLGNDGAVRALVTGGSQPYNFNWSNGQNGPNDTIATNLTSGFVTLTVTDSAGCIRTDSIFINSNSSLVASISDSGQVSCSGFSDGSLSVLVNGGISPYIFNWSSGSGGASDTISTGLSAGLVSVSITDQQGCAPIVLSQIIGQPDPLSTIVTTVDPACGSNNGKLFATVSGGTAPYQYNWLDNAKAPIGQTADSASGLSAGSYWVAISDTNGCVDSVNQSLNSVGGPLITLNTIQHPSINGACDGSINIDIATTGSGIASILWSPTGDTTEDISGKCAGNYSVSVQDSLGCISIYNDTLIDPPVGPAVVLSSGFDSTNCDTSICSGRVFVNVTGGTAPFQYTWSTNPTDTLFEVSGLCAGTYFVTVVDSVGMSATDTVVVPIPNFIQSVTATIDDVNCFGDSTGSIQLTTIGGGSPLSYNWQGFSSNNTDSLVGVPEGKYLVTITENGGCTAIDSFNVSENNAITANFNSIQPNCGQNDGQLAISVGGGSGSFGLLWLNSSKDTLTPSQTGDTLQNLAAGIYYVAIYDSAGCVDTAQATLNNVNGPSITLISKTNASANGVCDGAFDMDITLGGSPIDSILWSPTGDTLEDISGLCAGVYTITVTDTSGCIAFYTDTITEPDPIAGVSFTLSGIPSNCDTSICSGEIYVDITGGTAPFTYNWSLSAPINNDTVTGLCVGMYYVTVTDSNSTSAIDSFEIVASPAITSVTADILDPSCGNSNDGSITVHASGGTLPYSYSWSHNALLNDSIASGIGGATYIVTITENGGCSVTDTIVLNAPPTLIVSFDTTLANCGVNDGEIRATIGGGKPIAGIGYNLEWLDSGGNPFIPAETNDTLSNILAGQYFLSVSDSTCSDTFSIALGNIGGPIASLDNLTNPTCFGDADGQITINVVGGTAPLQYNWSPGGDTTMNINNLSAGVYNLTITDSTNCLGFFTDTLDNPAPLVVSSSVVSNISCFAVCDGEAMSMATGVQGTATYVWSNGEIGNAPIALCGGNNFVTVTDSSGCFGLDTVVLVEPTALLIDSVTTVDPNCLVANGSLEAFASGGTGSYTYIWNGTTGNKVLNNQLAGGFTLEILDQNGCAANTTVGLSNITGPTYDIGAERASCFGACDGEVFIGNKSGLGPFNVLWSQLGSSADKVTNVCAGSYSVEVEDLNGCKTVDTVTVREPKQITASFTIFSLPKCGNSNGKVIAQNIQGGYPGLTGYSYMWLDANKDPMSPPNTTDSLVKASSGEYYLRITDSTLCFQDIQLLLPNQGAPSIDSAHVSDASCPGVSNGEIELFVSGGATPYTFIWLPDSQTTQTAVGLSAGSYNVQVRDSNNCLTFGSYNILENNQLSIVPTVLQNMSCAGVNDGSATAAVIGGTTPLTFVWSNGETQDTATALGAGITQLTVTDAVGCSVDTNVSISAPTAMVLDSVSVSDPACGVCNGSIFIQISGGAGGYQYLWNNFQTSQSLTNLCAGMYTVDVTDANGCTAQFNIPLSNSSAPFIAGQGVDVSCFGQCDGLASVVILPGSGPYQVNWPTLFSSNDTVTGLCEGVYGVEVEDVFGCIAVDTISIKEPSQINVNFTKVLPTCTDSNGAATAIINGGTPSVAGYTTLWLDDNQQPWLPLNQTTSINNVPSGIYFIQVSDSLGCGGNYQVDLPNNVTPDVQLVSITDVSCSNVCDGQIDIDVSGNAPFNFNWSPTGFTSEDVTGLCSGTHTVVVTDSMGCVSINSYDVNETVVLTASTQINNGVSCFNICDASATINVTSTSGLVNYLWDNGEQTSTAVALCPGKHVVTVTDQLGCGLTDSVTIQSGNPIIISNVNTVAPTCGNDNGQIDVFASGGAGSLTYLWNNSATTSSISSLSAGTYSVTMFDQNGCIETTSIPISNSNGPTFNYTKLNPNCYGNCDGNITLNSIVGNGNVTIDWPSLNDNALKVANLCDGIYPVTLTDSLGCVTADTIGMHQPSQIKASYSTILADCGVDDGSASVFPLGGTPNQGSYIYFWLDSAENPIVPFQNTQTATGLEGGIYNVRITDSLGCELIQMVPVGETNGPLIQLENLEHATCDGVCDGEILTRVTPSATSTITWIPTGLNSDDIFNVCPGFHTIEAVDGSGCKSYETYEIFGLSSITTLISGKGHPTCSNVNDGNVEVTILGGTDPLSYQWTGANGFSSNLEDLTNVLAGTYSLVVSDANGCTDSISTDLFPNIEIEIEPLNDTTICSGLDSFNLSATIQTEFAPSVVWVDDFGNIQGTQASINVSPRLGKVIYTVTANSGGCVAIDTVAVTTVQFGPIDAGADRIILEGESTTLGGDPTGTVDMSFSWEPFAYLDDELAANPNATPDSTTTFIVSASNSDGCVTTDTVIVTVDPNIQVDEGFSPNGDGVNDTWTIEATQDYPLAEVEVYTRWGQLVYKSPVPYVGWDGTADGDNLPVGTYYYVIKLNDAAETVLTGPITIVR